MRLILTELYGNWISNGLSPAVPFAGLLAGRKLVELICYFRDWNTRSVSWFVTVFHDYLSLSIFFFLSVSQEFAIFATRTTTPTFGGTEWNLLGLVILILVTRTLNTFLWWMATLSLERATVLNMSLSTQKAGFVTASQADREAIYHGQRRSGINQLWLPMRLNPHWIPNSQS